MKAEQVLSISAFAIRRHIAIVMMTLAVVILGLFYLYRLPVDLLPSITYPRIGVRLTLPDTLPEIAVDEITRPLEEVLATTEGVESIFSRTREGQVSVDLYFRPGGNLDQALNDATAVINRARSTLPDTIESLRLFKFDPSQLPVYELALTSPKLEGVDLRIFAEEELGRELNVVPGVANVDVSGGIEEEVRIHLDLQRMQALGIGINTVLNTLRERNQTISGGRIEGENQEALIRTIGRFQSAQEIQDLPFTRSSSAQPIYLRDFADVIDGTEEQRIFVSLNGQPAVKVSIQKQPDANTVIVVEGVKKKLEQLRQSGFLSEDTILTATTDESVFIRNAIMNVAVAGGMGSLLAAGAVFIFLGSLRQTIIIGLAIPLSAMATIIFMGLSGLSLNVISLGGLAIGVGIVVDNSIVMLESIVLGLSLSPQHHSNRSTRSEHIISQAQASSQKVESALLASTSTNLVSVIPFVLIGGFFSLLFNELILTITFSVAASILVAVTIVPMLTSRLLAIPFSSHIGSLWPLRAFRDQFERATYGYASFLRSIVRFRLWVVVFSVLILGGSGVWMVQQIPQEILPALSNGQANVSVQFPPGTPLETNLEVTQQVDRLLLAHPDTEYVFSTAGGSLFGSNTSANTLRSSSTITLKPGSDVQAFVDQMTQTIDSLNLAGIRVRLRPGQVRGLIVSNSPAGAGSDVDVVLQGTDSELLRKAGRQVLDALDQEVSLAKFRPDADEPQPEIQILPNWERTASFGLTAQDIGDTVQVAVAGSVPTQLQRGNRLVDVRVQLQDNSIRAASELEDIPLFPANQQPIRLRDVATLQNAIAPAEIQRINQRQVFIVTGNLSKDGKLSDALAQVEEVLKKLELPPGITWIPSVARETNQQLQQSFKILGLLATFLVFVVMAVQYNSLVDPLVILLTIPLASSGGILGLYLTETPLGATVLVGAVLLIGIVVNNAIIMLELANQIREEEGITRQAAILKAAPQRLRPILMTTITTVLGLYPLAAGWGLSQGGEFLQPLGIVVFSGLSLATLLTLILIPCLYVLIHGFVEGFNHLLFPQKPQIQETLTASEKIPLLK